MKRLYKTESPIFVLLCVLYFERQPFRFLLTSSADSDHTWDTSTDSCLTQLSWRRTYSLQLSWLKSRLTHLNWLFRGHAWCSSADSNPAWHILTAYSDIMLCAAHLTQILLDISQLIIQKPCLLQLSWLRSCLIYLNWLFRDHACCSSADSDPAWHISTDYSEIMLVAAQLTQILLDISQLIIQRSCLLQLSWLRSCLTYLNWSLRDHAWCCSTD